MLYIELFSQVRSENISYLPFLIHKEQFVRSSASKHGEMITQKKC